MVKYYSFSGQRVAMRAMTGSGNGEVTFLSGDYLGSVSLATDASGNLVSQARYSPYGQVRWSGDSVMPTKYAFTGQRQDSFGLMDYHARFYSPYLNHSTIDAIIKGLQIQENDSDIETYSGHMRTDFEILIPMAHNILTINK